jgi:hypothetical protein
MVLSWCNGSMKLAGSAVFLWYPIAASALAGATQVVRKFGLAAVPHPLVAAAVTATYAELPKNPNVKNTARPWFYF